jgi:uncharacterized protein YeaO (DUF488 family)
MTIRVVRLGTPRAKGEGTRIGTVRRPPRGVPKAEFTSQNWYDVWFPILAPSVESIKLAREARTAVLWTAFLKKYRAEMRAPEQPRHQSAGGALTPRGLLGGLLL